MSDNNNNNNFSQIPINVSNGRQQQQQQQQQQQILTNPSSSSNLKSVSIHSNSNISATTNNNVNNNNKLNINSNSNNNINNGVKTNSTLISNNKQIKSTNDSYDLDYLDLNELNAIISKLKSDSYSMSHSSNNNNHNYNNNEKSPKFKNRLSLNIDNNSNSNSNNNKQLPPPAPTQPQSLQHQSSSQRRYESSLFKELIQFGIKREKLEKALAATGYSTSLEAINWLMKHSRDPILLNDSVISTRDYMLVMCPVGRLATQISSFFQQAKLKCGPNEAHYNNLLPYMKLSPFFKVFITFIYLNINVSIISFKI